MKVKIISGRSVAQGRGKESGKFSEQYFQSTATCELSLEDMKNLGISDGSNVKITSQFGNVVVKAFSAKQILPNGVVFIPYGPWASCIMDPETHGSGMPSLKGIEGELTPAPEQSVLKLDHLIKDLGKKSRNE